MVSLSFVSEVVRENLGTVMSVLESVWSLLLGNLSLAISTLTAAASLLLGGSLSILNALISVVSIYCISYSWQVRIFSVLDMLNVVSSGW